MPRFAPFRNWLASHGSAKVSALPGCTKSLPVPCSVIFVPDCGDRTVQAAEACHGNTTKWAMKIASCLRRGGSAAWRQIFRLSHTMQHKILRHLALDFEDAGKIPTMYEDDIDSEGLSEAQLEEGRTSLVERIRMLACERESYHTGLRATEDNVLELFDQVPQCSALSLSIRDVPPERLVATLRMFPRLSQINFSADLFADEYTDLITALSGLPLLTHLGFEYTFIKRKYAEAISQSLPSLTSLQSISFANTDIGFPCGWPNAAAFLAPAVTALPALKAVDVHNCSDKECSAVLTFVQHLAHATGLTELNVGRCWEGVRRKRVDFDDLGRRFAPYTALRSLNIDRMFLGGSARNFMPHIEHLVALTSFSLMFADLLPCDAAPLAESLAKLPELRFVDLSENHFGSEGCPALCRGLGASSSLRELHLNRCEAALDESMWHKRRRGVARSRGLDVAHLTSLTGLFLSYNWLGDREVGRSWRLCRVCSGSTWPTMASATVAALSCRICLSWRA